jgi:hypothetical protein
MPALHSSYAEILLSFHNWDVKKALVTFYENPFDALTPNTCVICCDVFEAGSSKLRDLESCEHKFCAECRGDYIVDCAKAKSSGLSIFCPHHECTAPLSPMEIAWLAPTIDD